MNKEEKEKKEELLSELLRFVIKQENKLNIGDGSINLCELVSKQDGNSKEVLQIVTSFKTSYENTFTVFVAQCQKNDEKKDFKIKFKYTGYQLWESPVKGFLSAMNQDFLIMSKEGMSFIRLDENMARRSIRGKTGGPKMVHSLSSMNYLKVENGNMLNIENQLDDSKIVMVQHASIDDEGCIQYEEMYKIKLEAMALNDLIFIQGVFLLDSVTEIMKMIELQPTKDVFFRSFMELDHSNLIQILSFESRFIQRLLEEVISSNSYNFESPLFYKMQHTRNE